MHPEGLNIRMRVDPVTGFLYGGNQWNAGTWMDKIGSSEKAGNRGVPATPRDGADIEIIGLMYSVLSFLGDIVEREQFPYAEITFENGEKVNYKQWAARLKANFEGYFWIPEAGSSPHVDEQYIHAKGIYKDVFGCSNPASDYMFRPNQCIAMAVAPDLFDREHALIALQHIDAMLLGDILAGNQLGVKTLSPDHPLYRCIYSNEDGLPADYGTAQGFSCHNGPEWLWPLGFAILAKLHFQKSPISHIMKHIVALRKHIAASRWQSLPDLTNSAGSFCIDSAPSSACSVATLLTALTEASPS
jgi:glycogen debranching enzyme